MIIRSASYLLAAGCAVLLLASCTQIGGSSRPGIDSGSSDFLVSIDPGRYDSTWWNRAPMRLIQTNLREIDAGMDRAAYVQSMVDASASIVLLNVGGIVANYPTRLEYHYRNPFMEGDLVGDLVTGLHANGIKVMGRFDFSKVNETIAAQKPEWLYVGTEGNHVNYNGQVHTCVNGGYQQEYIFQILEEAITTYPLDAIFFNMIGYQTSDYSGVNHGICQCENCKNRFLQETGHRLPSSGDMRGLAAEYNAFRTSTSRELFNRIHSFIRTLDPNIVINTYTDAGVDMITTESSSSLSPAYEWNYSATDHVKRTLGSYTDLVPNNLLIYFMAIGFRHVGTSPNLAKVWQLQNMLHGASLNLVVIGPLMDYPDRGFKPILEEVYGFHRENEKLFTNLATAGRVALIRGSNDEYRGLIKLLSEEHVMYDILQPSAIGSGRAPREIEEYEVVILGDVTDLSDSDIARLDAYVRNGGKLLATGFSAAAAGRMALESPGVDPEYELFQQARSTYLNVTDADKLALGPEALKDFRLLMMYSDFMKLRLRPGAEGYLQLIPNTMFGPPEKNYYTESEITDFPGLVRNRFGAGESVFIPWRIGSQYHFKGHHADRSLFMAALKNLLQVDSAVETDASHLIEMTHLVNRNGAFEWIGMINHSGQIGASLREPVPIHDTTVRLKPGRPVREVRLMRSGLNPGFTRGSDGWIEVVVPRVRDFEMVLFLYE